MCWSIFESEFSWQVTTREHSAFSLDEHMSNFANFPVVDLGEGPAPLILVKKEEMTERRKASRASKSNPPPPLLAQGLDPPLLSTVVILPLGCITSIRNKFSISMDHAWHRGVHGWVGGEFLMFIYCQVSSNILRLIIKVLF